MIKNYLTVAFRSIARSKIISFINIMGLALGIACAILIIFFIKDEITFDSFHSKAERIYRPWTKAKMRGRESINSATPFMMGKQLYENYEEIEKYTVWTAFQDLVEFEDKSFSESINIASEHFFEIFDFNVVSGSVAGTLKGPGDLIITEDIAIKFLGRSDVAGELLKIQVGGEFREFEIKAVLQEVPSNSSLQFGLIISDEHLKSIFPPQMLSTWFMITGDNYVLLSEGSDPETVSSKFKSLVDQMLADEGPEMEYSINLQPLKDIHLSTSVPAGNAPASDPKYIYILAGIAILILSIACINFMTLALGRSLSRTREIGVRKSIGAHRSQLVSQFLGESLMTSFLALIVGLALAYVSLYWFNELSGKSLNYDLSIGNLLIFIGLAFLVGIISGFYPAIVMSGFKSSEVIKGNYSIRFGKQRFRKILVGSQFVLSIFLIASTLIMKKQLNFIQSKNLGFDKENVVVIPVQVSDEKGLQDIIVKGFEKAGLFFPYLEGYSDVISYGVASHTFERGTWTNIGWMNEIDQEFNFYYNTVDAGYIPALGMEIVAGRNFSNDNPSDLRRSIIVNESFVRSFGIEDPIGAQIPNSEFDDHEIIGVVKDFHIESLHNQIQPLVLSMNINIGFSGAQNVNIGSSVTPKIFVRVDPGQISQTLSGLEDMWNEVYPEDPFDYTFIEENLKEQYESENNLENIVTSASVIAILVGCMGLFGLTSLTLLSRIKEVSIRKVFGATQKNLLLILSQSYAMMILVALLIAAPFSWYFMDNWLMQFEYKTDITLKTFLFAGSLTLLIALLTVSYQIIKITYANPAQSLRAE